MATAVNEHTGQIIKSGTSNYTEFSKNFDLIDSGIEYKQPETMFPVTIRIPKSEFKSLSEQAKNLGITLEEHIALIVLA